MNVKLNFLRGKSLRKTDIKKLENFNLDNFSLNAQLENYDKKNNKINSNRSPNRQNSIININNSEFLHDNNLRNQTKNDSKNFNESCFTKFFKKPLSFRISEFEEKNLLEKDETNKNNRTYASQRFLGNTTREQKNFFNDSQRVNGNKTGIKYNFSSTVNNFDNDKNLKENPSLYALKQNFKKPTAAELDDIEKVILVNNEEELIKKYVLPEIKFFSQEKRKKLLNYDVNDNSDKFIIFKGNVVLLSELLKKNTSEQKASHTNCIENNDLVTNQRFSINTNNETKLGMFPKFLMKSSSFVKLGESPFKKLVQPNIGFSTNMNLNSNLLSLQDYNNNGNSTNYILSNNNLTILKSNININKKKPKIEIIEEKFPHISKTSANGFAMNSIKNFKKSHKESKKNVLSNKSVNNFNKSDKNASKTINFNLSNEKNTTYPNKTSATTYNNPYTLGYISDSGYEINKNKNQEVNENKNNRMVYLDYPKIKFPIQPYKKFNGNQKIDFNYLTNGSTINDMDTIEKIKVLNQDIAQNIKKDMEVKLTNEMSENIDKLNVIEKKIHNLIEVSKENMRDNQKFKKFSSDKSIIIQK